MADTEKQLPPISESGGPVLRAPSPLITRRNRTNSVSERGMRNPDESGTIVSFCRTRGHGFVRPDRNLDGQDLLFVHISDIEDEFVPLEGDRVTFRLCPIPPKMAKHQAIHVRIINFCHTKHHRWSEPPTEQEKREGSLGAAMIN